jgi:hypothetical protein
LIGASPADASTSSGSVDGGGWNDAASVPTGDATVPLVALEGGAVLDAGTDAPVHPAFDGGLPVADGDPCPNVAVAVNCSSTCGTSATACSGVSCGKAPLANAVTIRNYSDLPYVIRTPDHPGVDPACETMCAQPGVTDTVPVYAIRFDVAMQWATPGVRLVVGAPWKIDYFVNSSSQVCGGADSVSGCELLPYEFNPIVVWTDDPNAPSRNIVIEETDAGKCP